MKEEIIKISLNGKENEQMYWSEVSINLISWADILIQGKPKTYKSAT